MSGAEVVAPATAYAQAKDEKTGSPKGPSTAFTCPFCGVLSQQEWGIATQMAIWIIADHYRNREYDASRSGVLASALCKHCRGESIFVNGRLIFPAASPAPAPVSDMPEEVLADFEEARIIVSASPRGAAALLRLVIQKLCRILGATKQEINAAIGELVANGTINSGLQRALDSVRVIGNEAVHPGTLDLKDDTDTALSLFSLVNFIVDKGITEPKQIDAIYLGLPPGKLAGIAQRDAPKS